MNSKVIIERVEFFSDARGVVVEPVPEALLAPQRNVHVVLTEPGCIRGNHYHERSTEICLVMGPALVRIREAGVMWDVRVPEREAVRFTLPPKVSHAIQNVGAKPILLVSFNTLPHDRANPDTVRDVLIEAPGQ